MPQQKWIICHAMSPGDHSEPAWFDTETNRPVVYDTQKEAVEAVLENHVSRMSDQLDGLRGGWSEPDEIDFDCDEWAEECTLHEDGTITTEYGELYNPKTFKR